jgi:hypothetical protein
MKSRVSEHEREIRIKQRLEEVGQELTKYCEALKTVRDEKLWRDYSSFEDYLKANFGRQTDATLELLAAWEDRNNEAVEPGKRLLRILEAQMEFGMADERHNNKKRRATRMNKAKVTLN